MHITIFGVGRSGTKAIQLYFAYILSRKEGSVWINYEPHFWLDRKTKAVNFEGFYHHLKTPHLLTDSEQLTKQHQKFLYKLAHHECSIVSKFIRSNGRIAAINQFFKPDYSFVIVRDIYEVLLSMVKTEWDFWSVGWVYHVSWDAFVEEIGKSGIIDRFDWCMTKINDRLDQNAFYWYVMNVAALKCRYPNMYFIDYKNISSITEIAESIFGNEYIEPINSKKFSGDNLHRNYPLHSIEKVSFRTHLFNQLLYKSQFFSKYGLYLASHNIGSKAMINKDYFLREKIVKSGTLHIQKNDLYDYFNEEIQKLLSSVSYQSRILANQA